MSTLISYFISPTTANYIAPNGVAVDGSGNVYVSDQGNIIYKILVATGVVTTLAGNGTFGNGDGACPNAQFNAPAGMTVDGSGTVYVADTSNHRVRVIK